MSFFPGFGGIILAPNPAVLSFVNGAAGFATTRTMPTGANTGDFVIHYDYPATGAGASTPSGWTTILSASSIRIIGRIIGASEPGVTGSSSGHKVIQAFRSTRPILDWSFSTWNFQTTSGDPTAQIVSAPPVGSIVFGYYIDADGGTSAFGTASPAFDGDNHDTVDGGYGASGYKIYNPGSSPASHTIDIGDRGGQNYLASGYITIYTN